MLDLDFAYPHCYEVQFIDVFGTHIGTRAETLSAWSGRGCDVKNFQLADAKATIGMLVPSRNLSIREQAAHDCAPFLFHVFPCIRRAGTQSHARPG
jgi:hypothetical protein